MTDTPKSKALHDLVKVKLPNMLHEIFLMSNCVIQPGNKLHKQCCSLDVNVHNDNMIYYEVTTQNNNCNLRDA